MLPIRTAPTAQIVAHLIKSRRICGDEVQVMRVICRYMRVYVDDNLLFALHLVENLPVLPVADFVLVALLDETCGRCRASPLLSCGQDAMSPTCSWRAFAFLCLCGLLAGFNARYIKSCYWCAGIQLPSSTSKGSSRQQDDRVWLPGFDGSHSFSLFSSVVWQHDILLSGSSKMDSTLSKNIAQQLLLAYFSSAIVLCAREYFQHRIIINVKAVTVMPNIHAPPTPVDLSTIGPRARALTSSINQAGVKASEADRAIKTLTVDNVTSTPVRPGVCRLMGVIDGPG